MSSAIQLLYGSIQGELYEFPEILGFTPLDLFLSGESGGWYDFSDTSKMWQDGAKTIQAVSDGDRVSVVEAQNAAAPDLVSFNSDKRPTVRVIGGVTFLEFDPSLGQNLEVDSAITVGEDWSVFLGTNFKNLTNDPHYIVDTDPGGPRIAQNLRASLTDLQSISFDNTGTPTTTTAAGVLSTGAWEVLHSIRDTNGLRVYYDSSNFAEDTIANTAATGSVKFFLGARSNATGGGGPFFDGYASQLVFVGNSAVTEQNRANTYNYIASRYPI